MTFIIALGYFCEQHGPVSIISTEPIIEKEKGTGDDNDEEEQENKRQNGTTVQSTDKETAAKDLSEKTLRTIELVKSTTCVSCRLILPRKESKVSSSDKGQTTSSASDLDNEPDPVTKKAEGKVVSEMPPPVFSVSTREHGVTFPHFKNSSYSITYMSSQYPKSQSRHYALKQACMSILSVEHCPSDTVLSASLLKRGSGLSSSCDTFPTSFFRMSSSPATISGTSHTGFCLSMRFRIPDSTARGLCRTYALMCVSECELQLARVASLVEATFDRTIASIVAAAEKAASATAQSLNSIHRQDLGSDTSDNEEEEANCNRSRTDGWTEYGPDRYLRRREGRMQNRSLVDLVGDDQVFVKLHSIFSNLLSALGSIDPPKRQNLSF